MSHVLVPADSSNQPRNRYTNSQQHKRTYQTKWSTWATELIGKQRRVFVGALFTVVVLMLLGVLLVYRRRSWSEPPTWPRCYTACRAVRPAVTSWRWRRGLRSSRQAPCRRRRRRPEPSPASAATSVTSTPPEPRPLTATGTILAAGRIAIRPLPSDNDQGQYAPTLGPARIGSRSPVWSAAEVYSGTYRWFRGSGTPARSGP